MEHLPVLVLGKISQYLSLRDITACSTTCRSWRDSFNQNLLWKPRCDQSIGAHLKVTECRVEPRFVTPEPERSSLSPICEWKLCYMRQVHLWNNWRHNRFVKNLFGSIRTKILSPFFHFLNNKQVLLKLQNEKEVMLWDVTGIPKHLSDPVTLCLGECIDFFEIMDDRIVLIQSNTVQIYNTTASDTNDSWRFQGIYNLTSTIYSAFLMANTLIAHCRGDVIEIFDVRSCKTIKVAKMPEPLNECVLLEKVMQVDKQSKHFAVLLKYQPSCDDDNDPALDLREAITVYVFSIEKMDFLNFVVTIRVCDIAERDFSCLMYEELLAIFNNGSICIYNYLTMELILEGRNIFSYSGTVHLFSEINMLHSTLYVRGGKTNGTIFFHHQLMDLVPVAVHCLGYATCNSVSMFEYVRKHRVFPNHIDSISLLSQYPSSVINHVYTKYIDKNGPVIVTFW